MAGSSSGVAPPASTAARACDCCLSCAGDHGPSRIGCSLCPDPSLGADDAHLSGGAVCPADQGSTGPNARRSNRHVTLIVAPQFGAFPTLTLACVASHIVGRIMLLIRI